MAVKTTRLADRKALLGALGLLGAGGIGYWWWTRQEASPPPTSLEEILRQVGLIDEDAARMAEAILQADQDIRNAQAGLDEAAARAQEASDALSEIGSRASRYEDLRQAMQAHTSRLGSNLEGLRGLREELATRLGEGAPEVQQLDHIIQVAGTEISALKADLLAMQQTGQVTVHLLEQARTKMIELEARLSATQDALADLQQRVAGAIASTNRLLADMDELKQQVNRLKVAVEWIVFARDTENTLEPALQNAAASAWSPPYAILPSQDASAYVYVGQDNPHPQLLRAEAELGSTYVERPYRLRFFLGGVNFSSDRDGKKCLCYTVPAGWPSWYTGYAKELIEVQRLQHTSPSALEVFGACKCGAGVGDHIDEVSGSTWIEARDSSGKVVAKSGRVTVSRTSSDGSWTYADWPTYGYARETAVEIELNTAGSLRLYQVVEASSNICSPSGLEAVSGASGKVYPLEGLQGAGSAPATAGRTTAGQFPQVEPQARREGLGVVPMRLQLGPVKAAFAVGIFVLPFDQRVAVNWTDVGSTARFDTWPMLGFYLFGVQGGEYQELLAASGEYHGNGRAQLAGTRELDLPAGVYGVVAWAGGSFEREAVGQLLVTVDWQEYTIV